MREDVFVVPLIAQTNEGSRRRWLACFLFLEGSRRRWLASSSRSWAAASDALGRARACAALLRWRSHAACGAAVAAKCLVELCRQALPTVTGQQDGQWLRRSLDWRPRRASRDAPPLLRTCSPLVGSAAELDRRLAVGLPEVDMCLGTSDGSTPSLPGHCGEAGDWGMSFCERSLAMAAANWPPASLAIIVAVQRLLLPTSCPALRLSRRRRSRRRAPPRSTAPNRCSLTLPLSAHLSTRPLGAHFLTLPPCA